VKDKATLDVAYTS